MPIQPSLPLLALLLLSGQPAAAPAQPYSPAETAMLALRELDQRVAETGYRLAAANAELCADRQPLPGLLLHHLSQYGAASRTTAASLFRLGAAPALLAVVPGSPAYEAGLRPDDLLLAVNGARLDEESPALTPDGDFAPVEAAMDLLDQALAAGPVELLVEREGSLHRIRLAVGSGCASRFQLVPGAAPRAKADGRYVQISSGLAATLTDEELAAVLAHELAHNILRHRGRINQAGRNSRSIRLAEIEADALSVYLLDRAGYDPEAPARFWRRFRAGPGIRLFGAATHPNWRERVRSLEAEADRLRLMKRSDPRPIPPLLSKQ